MLIGDIIRRTARYYPGKTGVVYGDRRLTWQEVNARVNKLANALLGIGLRKPDRIGMLSRNSHQYLEFLFAAGKAGLIAVPLNTEFRGKELLHVIRDSGVKALIIHPDFVDTIGSIDSELDGVIKIGTGAEQGDAEPAPVSPAPFNIPVERRTPQEGDLAIISDSEEDIARSIIATGLRDKLDVAFHGAIARARGARCHPYTYDFESLVAGSPDGEPEVAVSEDDLWLLAYTSGTTGKPKGATMSQRNGVAGAANDIWTLKVDSSDTYLVSGPFYLNSAGGVRCATVMAGATLIIMTYEAESVLRTIEKERVTRFHGGPTMLSRLAYHPSVNKYNVSSVRGIAVTGAPLRASLWKKLEEVFGRVVYPIYGLTENCGDATVLRREEVAFDGGETLVRRLGSVGKPTLLVDVRVVDEKGSPVAHDGKEVGEAILRGDPVTRGYWNDAEKTASVVRDGWFYTGDLATVDEDGYVYIVDRKSDTIKSGGRQIYPRELEDVIMTHPAVLRCAVFRVPDSQWGETPRALVELKEGAKATEEEIIELCRKSLASYKKPASVEFVTGMPMTPSGKILKKELMEQYWKGHEKRIG